jgi:transposase
MRAYSEDLRQKIVDAIQRGMPNIQAARTFGVGIWTVKRYATKAEKGETLEPGKAPSKQPKMDELAVAAKNETTRSPTSPLP